MLQASSSLPRRVTLLRSSGLIVLAVLSASIGLLGGWEVMFRLAYLMLALYGLSLAWALLASASLVLDRRPLAARSQVGRQVSQQLTLRSRLPLWVPWVEVRDGAPQPSDGVERVVSLGPGRSHTWTGESVCTRRGKVPVGPTWLRTGDAFGLFAIEREVQPRENLLVLPETVPLSYAPPGGSESPNETTEPRLVSGPSAATRSVRDYQSGDPLRHVHWTSTARLGHLMVREFEPDRGSDVVLVLDLDAGVHAGRGRDSTEEQAVTATASLFAHLIGRSVAVGLVSQAIALPPARGRSYLQAGLERLALLQAQRGTPLSKLLARNSQVLERAAAIVVVTPAHPSSWSEAAMSLSRANRKLEVVQVEAPGAASHDTARSAARAGARRAFPLHLWRRGRLLDAALAWSGVGGSEVPAGRR